MKIKLINRGSMRFRRFADDYDSGENSFVIKTNFDIPVQDKKINTTIKLDYLEGTFDRSFLTKVS